MLNEYLIYVAVSLAVAASSFLMSGSIIFAIVVLAIFLCYFFLYERMMSRKQKQAKTLANDLNYFIHDFIYGYAKNNDLTEGLNQSTLNVSYALVEHLELVKEYPVMERLEQLSSYFHHPIYLLFLDNLRLAVKEKSDLLVSANFLLEENDRLLDERKLVDKQTHKALAEFILLWTVSFLILIILRFAIANQFANISTTWVYLIGLIIYYAFFLMSLYLFTYTKQGSHHHE
ncbi:MAG: hypothetical protein MJ207_03770 [Bacilli bacterium]|nr:hypothetical protein [Bacilli bacterium]